MIKIAIKYSLVIPIYNCAEYIPLLVEDVNNLAKTLESILEVILVIDGSLDNSNEVIKMNMFKFKMPVKVINLSRNFGSYVAIRVGIDHARGRFVAIKSADRQEPMTLVRKFFEILIKDQADIVVGVRAKRDEGLIDVLISNIFWNLYKRFINKEMPDGGVDMFGINDKVIPYIRQMQEKRSSLVEYLFWMGFRRKKVMYSRLKRRMGKGGWTLKKKLDYMTDSVFAVSNIPIKVFYVFGVISMIIALSLAVVVLWAKLSNIIQVPGYTATVLVILFFFSLNSLGISIMGSYLWRTYENTKLRPNYIVADKYDYQPD